MGESVIDGMRELWDGRVMERRRVVDAGGVLGRAGVEWQGTGHGWMLH